METKSTRVNGTISLTSTLFFSLSCTSWRFLRSGYFLLFSILFKKQRIKLSSNRKSVSSCSQAEWYSRIRNHLLSIQELARFCTWQTIKDKGELCARCWFALPMHSSGILWQDWLRYRRKVSYLQLLRISSLGIYAHKYNIKKVC